MHNLTSTDWQIDNILLFRTHCLKMVKECDANVTKCRNLLESLEFEKQYKFWLKALVKQNQLLDSFFKSPEYDLTPYLNMVPNYDRMTAEEHAALQNRYYQVINKINELEKLIHQTVSPTNLAIYNGDMRALLDEKEEIFKYIIEFKP